MKLNRAQANKIWSLLTEKYGAPKDDWSAVHFVGEFTGDLTSNHPYHHNKFIGHSGSGNIEMNAGGLHAWYVSDYRTPYKDMMFERLNKELRELWDGFKVDNKLNLR